MRAVKIGRLYVIFRPLGRKTVGACRKKRYIIEIDLSKDFNPAKTLVHELIHLLKPKWNEKKVLKHEKRVWAELSDDERLDILRVLVGG